jgi:ribosomal protein S27AE
MSEDPKPCPVCGPGTFLHHTPLPKFAIRIECEECGFPGPLAGNYMDTSQIEADNAAIRAWNGVVEQLEAQRKYSAMDVFRMARAIDALRGDDSYKNLDLVREYMLKGTAPEELERAAQAATPSPSARHTEGS